ncbi:MAG: right-handed parallel beta-helix repeat-containing protein [Methylocystis sp.]|uniref:right-handed parallel beta-helix repeat-containing protein n=1 Tax=Methylocystis sp. TaxID=1911079 RepID=UPI003D122245
MDRITNIVALIFYAAIAAPILLFASATRAYDSPGPYAHVSVTDFVGVDPSGTEDSSIGISRAISNGRRVVKFGCGTYLVANAINLPSHTRILGSGRCTVIKESPLMKVNPNQLPQTNPVRNIFSNSEFVSGNSDIEIRNITLDAAEAPVGANFMMLFYKCTNITVDNVLFITNSKINTDGTAFVESSMYQVTNNYCMGAQNACFDQWSNAHDFVIKDNICDGIGMRSDRCILVNGLSSIHPPGITYNGLITGNLIKNISGVGIGVYGLYGDKLGYTGRVHHMEISNNIIEGVGFNGIIVAEGDDLIVKGNTIKNVAKNAIKVAQASLTQPTTNIIIADNYIEEANFEKGNESPIDIGNGSARVNNVTLFNNFIKGNSHTNDINVRAGVSNVCISLAESQQPPRVGSPNPEVVRFRLNCANSSQSIP